MWDFKNIFITYLFYFCLFSWCNCVYFKVTFWIFNTNSKLIYLNSISICTVFLFLSAKCNGKHRTIKEAIISKLNQHHIFKKQIQTVYLVDNSLSPPHGNKLDKENLPPSIICSHPPPPKKWSRIWREPPNWKTFPIHPLQAATLSQVEIHHFITFTTWSSVFCKY